LALPRDGTKNQPVISNETAYSQTSIGECPEFCVIAD